ncbi:MAG TPA: PTS sugar transporter subunit IIA [Propionicimonas sp.]|uniref:BglG family transcription antiterminator n=1 Tax=Propionicimonas sp. TaxID=1955623 RepID=UPI002F404546
MSFSERESLMLEVLREAGRPIVGAHLADLLGVSPRTLRYDIGRINRMRGVPLVGSDAAGYSLNLDAYRQALSQELPVTSALDDDERLLVYLLDHELCDVYDAARDCFVSESTVRSSTARLGPRLAAHGLVLGLTGSRMSLHGSELDRRRVLGGLVREATNAAMGSQWRLRRLLPDVDLDAVENAIERGLDGSDEPIDDISRQNLVVNLAICLQRSGHPIDAATGDPETSGNDERTRAVVHELLAAFPSHSVSEGDRAYLQRLVWVALDNSGPDESTSHDTDEDALNEVVTRAVDDCVAHFDLKVQREKLITSITQHTRRLVARKATLVYFRNGLRESLRTRSPYLYDVAVYLAHKISSALEVWVTDDEISLFAIYLGLYTDSGDDSTDTVRVTIVCPRYQTLREWLLARFVEHLGEKLAIVDVVTTMQAADATDCEMIVTTMGGGNTSRPVVEISALCSEMDLDSVRAEVARIRDERLRRRTGSALARFLDPRLFFVDAQLRNSAETIDFMCDQMIAAGKVPASYTKSVKVREDYSSTGFAYRFAVPHSMDFIAHQTTIAVLIPKAPIRWGETDVVMVLMLALNQDDYIDFTWFYQRLVQLLCDPELFSELRSKRDFPSFREYLAAQLSRPRRTP